MEKNYINQQEQPDLSLNHLQLNDLGDDNNEPDVDELAKKQCIDRPFAVGENKIVISNGSLNVEMHCTNSTVEQVAQLSIWMMQQLQVQVKDDKTKDYFD